MSGSLAPVAGGLTAATVLPYPQGVQIPIHQRSKNWVYAPSNNGVGTCRFIQVVKVSVHKSVSTKQLDVGK